MNPASHHALRETFRGLLAGQTCIRTASVFDPLSARIAADLGFEAGILGGSVASLQVLGAPDIALLSLSEFAEQATRIGRVARLPVIADADHGYGNALNVMRCVAELERAGVAALTLEDTLLPTRFDEPLFELISLEEATGKLRAAQQARQDHAMAIIARTHAGVQSLQQVIQRTRAYQEAGADGICLIGVRDFEQLEAIVDGLRVPVMMVVYGSREIWDEQRLARLGVRVVVDGHGAFFAGVKAVYEALRVQRGLGVVGGLQGSELVGRYSFAEEYLGLAREYVGVIG